MGDVFTERPFGRIPVHFRRQTTDADDRPYVVKRWEDDAATRTLMNKRWEGNSVDSMKPLLKRFCVLQNQDPSLFLPANPLDILVDPDGTGEDDLLETRFNGTMDSRGMAEFTKTNLAVPGVLHISRKNQRQWMVFDPPNNKLDDELMFFGELYVSRLLEMHLDKHYKPETHWTSSLRTRAGLNPFHSTAEYVPAFTIDDTTKSLSKVLGKKGLEIPVSATVSHIRFHIDVLTVEGELEGSQFFMHPKQLKNFEDHRLPDNGVLTQPRPVVPVLIVVCRVHAVPSAVIIHDPFARYRDGSLQLSYPGHLRGRFRLDSSEQATLEDAVETSLVRSASVRMHRRISSLSSGIPKFDYKYQSLPSHRSIRLLELQPDGGTKSNPLRGKILTLKSLDAAKEFDALSYPWGISIKPHRIYTPDGVAWLTQSCYLALRSIRRADSPTLVWVDSLCIDQDNAHEKAIQIRLMRDIFRAARHVYACVGEAENDSSLAIRTLVHMRALHRMRNVSSQKLPLPTAEESSSGISPDSNNSSSEPPLSPSSPAAGWGDAGIPPDDDPAWPAIDHFLGRPWFRRAWVTQEAILARDLTVICGPDRVSWDELFDGLTVALVKVRKLMEANMFHPPRPTLQRAEPAAILGRTRRLYSRRNGTLRLDLLSLLDRFTHTKASLDRDKLFALVGLACDADDDVFNADYASPLEKVVRRYASEFARRDRVLDLLYRAGLDKGYPFASWIPRWTEDAPRRRRTISTWSGSRGPFSACGRGRRRGAAAASLFARICPSNAKLLEITGTVVDTVTSSLGEKTQRESDFWTVQNEIHRLLRDLDGYPTGEPIADVQTRLPIGDAGRPYREGPADLELEDAAAQGGSLLDGGGSGGGGGEEDLGWAPGALTVPSIQELFDYFSEPAGQDCGRMWQYWETAVAFSLRLGHGRFAITSRGYAGLVPHGTQPGDKVVVFHGAAVPFVIRYHAVKKEWTLVGECYVHGLMYGEAEALGEKEQQILIH